MKKSPQRILGILVVAAFLVAGTSSTSGLSRTKSGGYIIKYGTIAPSGTTWDKVMKQARKELSNKSGGKLKLRIYGGGKAGSEKNMISKLKLGNLDMIALTGLGLGLIYPKSRVLELPFFFRNTKQVDKVVKKLYPTFKADLAKKGYVLAGWGEAGWVYVMSKTPIRSYNDMKGLKVWAPVGDKLVKSMFEEYGLVPVYLSFEAVLPQLQTGGLDAVYAPPVGAIGLQWFRHVKYISNARLANATGATLIRKKSYETLPENLRKILLETSEKYAVKLIKRIRRDNRSALKTLQKRGLKLVEVNKKDLSDLKKKAGKIQNKLVGKLYSRSFLNLAKSAR